MTSERRRRCWKWKYQNCMTNELGWEYDGRGSHKFTMCKIQIKPLCAFVYGMLKGCHKAAVAVIKRKGLHFVARHKPSYGAQHMVSHYGTPLCYFMSIFIFYFRKTTGFIHNDKEPEIHKHIKEKGRTKEKGGNKSWERETVTDTHTQRGGKVICVYDCPLLKNEGKVKEGGTHERRE